MAREISPESTARIIPLAIGNECLVGQADLLINGGPDVG